MSTFYQNKTESICSNCGGTGHGFRICTEPVSSYGVLVFRWVSRSEAWPQVTEFCNHTQNPTGITGLIPQVLMIQRKDSLGFMDIMRGKYKVNEPEYIKKQLRGMTYGEREKLRTMEFEEIWHELWGSDTESTQRYAHDRINSRQKLAELRSGVQLPNGEKYSLSDLLRQEPALYTTPEWGFPKGRRDPYESDIRCAFRELEEETSITEQELLKVTNVSPFIEQFYGSNNIHYRHTYYIAQYIGERAISFDALNAEMAREIGNLAWKNLDEAVLLLRPENLEKRGIIIKLGSLLRNYSPVLRNNLLGKALAPAVPAVPAVPTTLTTLVTVNENANEEQQEYVFTGQSTGFSISGKVEKSRRFFGARQTTRRISDIYRSNQGGNDQRNQSRISGTGGNTISRH
uniref:Nudix hydrolase domain-containing protein n=1 Tax=viral metagenome TaxID=1070528 RepID=A0A6C0ANU9_9ZZZZ